MKQSHKRWLVADRPRYAFRVGHNEVGADGYSSAALLTHFSQFFIAFFEAAFQPVSFFLLGSWYTKPELAKRVAIWFVASPAGSAFSSYMQAGIYNGMDGLAGLAGWRWLYIICGIMSELVCGDA